MVGRCNNHGEEMAFASLGYSLFSEDLALACEVAYRGFHTFHGVYKIK
jgi:hypothetical protein